MSRSFAETLIFCSVAFNAALLLFIAGVLRKVMNAMREEEFLTFMRSLVHYSSRSAFMITALNVPLLGSVPYFYFFGFANSWIIAGLALWLAAGLLSKLIKYPIYRRVVDLPRDDIAAIRHARKSVNQANIAQATLYTVAAVLAAVALR